MHFKSLFAYLSLLAVMALAGLAPAKPAKINILSSQSNLAGRGTLRELNKSAAEIHVSPNGPVRTLVAAQKKARETKSPVIVHAGTYYLEQPLTFTAEDAGTSYSAAPGERVVISGGMKLDLKWGSSK